MIILLAGCLQSWKEFSSAEGRYTVLMPGAPTEKTQNLKTPVGDLSMHGAFLDHNHSGYLVMYNDFPEAFAQAAAQGSAALTDSRDSLVEGSHGKLVGDQAITLMGKYPGREIQMEMPDGTRALRARMYLVKNRMYRVVITALKDDLFTKDANKFMESFKIQEN